LKGKTFRGGDGEDETSEIDAETVWVEDDEESEVDAETV
jgi:hypothetical protein